MKLIPAISIKNGRVVVVEHGSYVYPRNEEGEYRNPVKLIKEFKSPGEEIFVLDIDGLERNSPDLETVKKIAAHRDVWLDAGVGDADSMMDLFVSDASRVVMGTICLQSLNELRNALAISDKVIFSIGYDGTVVSPDPALNGIGPGQLISMINDMPNLGAGLFFDVGGIKVKNRIDLEIISQLAPLFKEFYVSGYITGEDFEAFERAGVHGAIMDFRTIGEMGDG